MKSTAHLFTEQARAALADDSLQAALRRAKSGFIDKRAAAIAAFPDFDGLRERGRRIKDHTLAHLDHYLERFADAVEARGGHVHWARDADEARRAVLDICQRAQARSVIKGKTMVGEEIGINGALEQAGLEVVETDLGEYIIQLAKEPPSHIIAPAVHKTRAQICQLFAEHHGSTAALREAPELVAEARAILREKFLAADVGITGGNFLVAETGTVVLVTNEGNGDLSLTLPRVHIVLAGIEKLVPTLDDAATMVRLLARSATGQEISTYTTFITGPRRANEPEGPDEYHVVLLDNGRARMLADEFREMLRCIRCGACLNHCPVYSAIGGHAYGWVYPGPMGSVLTPQFIGLDGTKDLPNACTLNGRCQEVCPVKIPLPSLLRRLRDLQFERRIIRGPQRWALRLWGWVARRPRLYHRLAALGARFAPRGAARRLPLDPGWTQSRDFPLPKGRTFQSAWQERQRQENSHG